MLVTEKDIHIKQGEGYEDIILPEGDRPWIGGINGTFYSISRGTLVRVPQNLAALIRQNEMCNVLAVKEISEYISPEGKQIGGNG